MPENGEKIEKPGDDTPVKLAGPVGEKLVSIFITAGSLLGFVAFAGAVILWTRLEAVEIPPEQAIDVAPQGELVAIGASYLLVLGFFGALALMGTFMIDRSARPTPGMARALLGLLALEGIAALVFVDGPSMWATVVACELFVLPLAAAFLGTMISPFSQLKDDLWPRDHEELEPDDRNGLLRSGGQSAGQQSTGRRARWLPGLFVYGPIGLVAVAMIVAGVLIAWGVGSAATGRVLSAFCVLFALWFLTLVIRDGKAGAENETEAGDDERQLLPRPQRLRLTAEGFALTVGSVVIGTVLVLAHLGLGEWWVGVSLAVAALIVAALWRISELVNQRLVWFGVAVFLSVPLFGTLMTVVKNIAHPKVQPLALIRKTDGPNESIQGLYVTETSSRIYFANIATEGCEEDLVPRSGRLLSLPKDEVVAMSLGPLQSVKEASKMALEMSYALTPSIETPDASVLLPGDAARQKKAEREEADASWTDTRLENAGPAVRPDFGAGLRLDPDSAGPGGKVTLSMSKPNDSVGGFGASREGHNLRIGGVVADIAKEPAHRLTGAEYIKVVKGSEERLIKLDSEGPYVLTDDGFALVADVGDEELAQEPRRYVRLNEPRLRAVDGRTLGDAVYVRVSEENGIANVAMGEGRKFTLAGGRAEGRGQGQFTASLAGSELYRQAWHENRITFTVPGEARTGVVTVECDQLAGSPLLQVSHDPTARIAVQMQAHKPAITFDSSRSGDEDDGDKITRRWIVEGIRRGNGKTLTTELPVRDAPYSVELTVTDATGHSDTTKLQLLRLPASTFEFDQRKPLHPKAVRTARRALRKAVRAQPPVAIELDGHADDPGTPAYNLKLSLERDDEVRSRLLEDPSESKSKDDAPTVPVQELAYGETCRLDRRGGRQPRNRRVDVFVLSEGVTVSPPEGCHPGHLKSVFWHLPPPQHEKDSKTP